MVEIPLPGGLDIIAPTSVVVHAMAEIVIGPDRKAHYATEWLRREGTSAHLFVTPSGTIIKSREYDQGAWHCRADKRNWNSIGIEFLVAGAHDWNSFVDTISRPYLTDAQYKAGVKICKEELFGEIGITQFDKHSKLDPVRKRDPGAGYPWDQFIEDVLVYKPS
jgi:N-acetyl-anhydromuramyl-L-alanine amidase AmpD